MLVRRTVVPLFVLLRAMSSVTASASATSATFNVLGTALAACSVGGKTTGFFRDGFCHTGPSDSGRHVVAAVLTKEFLEFTASRGNDLMTPRPPWFPGLQPGDRWCLCALRWAEALEAGVAPPVVLEATNEAALRYVRLQDLQAHEWRPQQQTAVEADGSASNATTNSSTSSSHSSSSSNGSSS